MSINFFVNVEQKDKKRFFLMICFSENIFFDLSFLLMERYYIKFKKIFLHKSICKRNKAAVRVLVVDAFS